MRGQDQPHAVTLEPADLPLGRQVLRLAHRGEVVRLEERDGVQPANGSP